MNTNDINTEKSEYKPHKLAQMRSQIVIKPDYLQFKPMEGRQETEIHIGNYGNESIIYKLQCSDNASVQVSHSQGQIEPHSIQSIRILSKQENIDEIRFCLDIYKCPLDITSEWSEIDTSQFRYIYSQVQEQDILKIKIPVSKHHINSNPKSDRTCLSKRTQTEQTLQSTQSFVQKNQSHLQVNSSLLQLLQNQSQEFDVNKTNLTDKTQQMESESESSSHIKYSTCSSYSKDKSILVTDITNISQKQPQNPNIGLNQFQKIYKSMMGCCAQPREKEEVSTIQPKVTKRKGSSMFDSLGGNDDAANVIKDDIQNKGYASLKMM